MALFGLQILNRMLVWIYMSAWVIIMSIEDHSAISYSENPFLSFISHNLQKEG